MDTHKVLRANLARLATVPLDTVGDDTGAAHLEQHLGIDSLALLELVTALEHDLGIVIPDEETGEATAHALDEHLDGPRRAYTVVAGAAVTQASTAIPSIALYTSLLHRVLGEGGFQSNAQQMTALWQQLDGEQPLVLDDTGRIRLDGWELATDVQDRVRSLWSAVTTENVADSADTVWFRRQVGQLYGWDVPEVDYDVPCETTVAWPGNPGWTPRPRTPAPAAPSPRGACRGRFMSPGHHGGAVAHPGRSVWTAQVTDARVPYLLACAAPPAQRLPTGITLAQQAGWDVCLVLSPSAY